MKNKLTQNLGLKIASFLCAALLWLVVTNINDPVASLRVTDVPVTIKNAELITDRGQVYEVLDDTDTIDVVTISAPRSIIDALDKSNVVAVADVNDLTSVDTVAIRLSTNKYSDKLESIRGNIDSVKLRIEERQVRSLPLRPVATGKVREGYMVGDATTDQNLLRISGPASVIARVSKAQAEVDISGFASSIGTDCDIHLYDEDGKAVSSEGIEKSISKVRVNVEILQMKKLPLSCKVSGTPAEGYQFTGEVAFTRAQVTVAGKSKTVESLNAIEIPSGAVTVDGADEDVTTLVDLHDYLPEGVILAEENFQGMVNVTAKVEAKQERSVRIPVGKIRFSGLPEGFRALVTEPANECSVTLRGLRAVLDEIAADEVTATVDLEAWMAQEEMDEITKGSYWMPVQAAVEGKDVQQSGATEVRVHILEEE